MARTKEFDEKEVLDKAVNLFWEKGYDATSAQDLVDALGISRSSLYDTFGDKRALFIQALRYYQQTKSNVMIAQLDAATDEAATIRNLFKAIVEETGSEAVVKGCFMVNTGVELSLHDAEINALVKNNNDGVEDALTRIIQRGQDKGVFTRKKTARSLAHFLFNNISGLRVAARSGVSKRVMEETIDVVLSALQ
ncbi:TetR/AcrR family transcriptional regulator [Deminuibacter soli]|uniref:TetR/AcrR family transcriptional regulator n=1 Tax=Deminuibacter soli TaxID=2291815 RepID=A0A3E1NES1_9BACT|nr:TetR/AcrR family transcriptional regulator [Deminuibacter soli]RFM26476.1 TetR/AcrR family transcriptional regulator [Deminuibacter soli]